jgi:hypothetical protein
VINQTRIWDSHSKKKIHIMTWSSVAASSSTCRGVVLPAARVGARKGAAAPWSRASFSSTSAAGDEAFNVRPYIRSAQATEIFRAEFYRARKSDVSISPRDLDEIVVDYKVRPSALVGVLEVVGYGLGTVARVVPKSCADVVTKVVEDATSQQFNDSIRDLSAQHVCEDVKETINYHRDLNTKKPDVAAAAAAAVGPQPAAEVMFAMSSALSAALNLTKTV